MNAVNKFTGFNSAISPEPPKDHEVSGPTAQSSDPGIGEALDSLEAFQAPVLDLTPAVIPAESPISYEIMEQLVADPAALPADAQSRLQEIVNGPGEVDWDAITALKAAMDLGDSAAMMQILEKLRPNDLAATLTALAKRGTPSDLQLMTDRMCADPKTFQKMAEILASLASNRNLPASTSNPLDQILSRMEGKPGTDAVVRDLIQATKGQGILPRLSLEGLTSMYKILHADPKVISALFENTLFEETQRQPIDAYGLRDPTKVALENLKPPYTKWDPSIPDAMKLYPEWGIHLMNQVIAMGDVPIGNQNFPAILFFIDIVSLQGKDDSYLAEFCKQGPQAESVLSEYFRVAQGSEQADQIVRKIVQNLGESAVQILGKFSSAFLTDLKAILIAGTDKTLDQDVIANVIDPALNAARVRETLTDGIKQSAQNFRERFEA
jgi:hypothetical protein